jgi:hypothetical protein
MFVFASQRAPVRLPWLALLPEATRLTDRGRHRRGVTSRSSVGVVFPYFSLRGCSPLVASRYRSHAALISPFCSLASDARGESSAIISVDAPLFCALGVFAVARMHRQTVGPSMAAISGLGEEGG